MIQLENAERLKAFWDEWFKFACPKCKSYDTAIYQNTDNLNRTAICHQCWYKDEW